MIKQRAHSIVVSKEVASTPEQAANFAKQYAEKPLGKPAETDDAYHFTVQPLEKFHSGSVEKFPGEAGVHVLKGTMKGDKSNQRAH